MNEKEILRMENVSYSYTAKSGKTVILQDADYVFYAGKLYAIMGPSGSGKTTTLSLLEALDEPQGGRIFFRGKEIGSIGADRYRRQNAGIIFQSYNLFPYLTVRENVEVAIEIAQRGKAKRKQAESLLKKMGFLETQYGRKIEQLSGGEQQRVAIARALVSDAQVILADEPTGNLDEKTAAEIRDIFCEVAHMMGKCVIVVTHSPAFAGKADEVVLLRGKKLVKRQESFRET